MKEFIYLSLPENTPTAPDDKEFYFTEKGWLIMWKKKIKIRKLVLCNSS